MLSYQEVAQSEISFLPPFFLQQQIRGEEEDRDTEQGVGGGTEEREREST